MSITIGGYPLPDGLLWSDEYGWSPIVQAIEWTIGGYPVIEKSTRQSGRPITLVGGANYAWMRRSELDQLRALLLAEQELTLVLHDNRVFTVTPLHDGDGPLVVNPRQVVQGSGLANPGPDALYVIESLRLMEV